LPAGRKVQLGKLPSTAIKRKLQIKVTCLKNRITRRLAKAFLDRLSLMSVGTIHASCLAVPPEPRPQAAGGTAVEARDAADQVIAILQSVEQVRPKSRGRS
jgi:hypothetical protein